MTLELPPGRSCPTAYRYAPRVFDRAPDFEAEALYVVGGLYGNVEALEEIAAMACWLATEDCSFTTGGVFDISGGRATY